MKSVSSSSSACPRPRSPRSPADFAGDRIDLTAFGFTRSELEQYVTIEEERFLIDTGEVVIRVEVGVELDLADFIE